MADPVSVMLRDLRRECPWLSRCEVRELGLRWRDHADMQARDRLILSILPWSVTIAKKFIGLGVDVSDLYSLGMMGAIIAVDHFDPDKGALTTIAHWHIRQVVSRYVAGERYAVRIPPHHAFPASADKHYGPESRASAKRVLQGVASLSLRRSKRTGDESLQETIPDLGMGPVEEAMVNEEEMQQLSVYPLVDRLPDRERSVILARLRRETLQQIAKAMGISKERVRQLESRAVQYLRVIAEHVKPEELIVTLTSPTPTMSRADDMDPVPSLPNGSHVDLSTMLDTVTTREVQAAISRCEEEFEAAKNKYHNRMQALRVWLKACEARDGHKHTDAEAAGQSFRGKRTHKHIILDYLQHHGPATNKAITAATGISGSSASATLVCNKELFMRVDVGWDLTKSARDQLKTRSA